MKKTNAVLVCILLVVFMALGWVGLFRGQASAKETLEKSIEIANKLEAKGIYIDALEQYKKAQTYDPQNVDIALKIADMYENLGDTYGFISACNQASSIDSGNPTPYVRKIRYYIDEHKYSDAIKAVRAVPIEVSQSDEIKELEDMLSKKCVDKYAAFEDVSDWHVQDKVNYLVAERDGKKCLVKKDGRQVMRAIFDYLGAYDSQEMVLPCKFEDIFFYVDTDGNRRLIGDIEYSFLGSFGNGFAPASKNGKYGFIDRDFNEYSFEYDDAGAFANNIAKVSKDGKCGLINTDFKEIGKIEYEEILVDSYGYCSVFETIIAKSDGAYIFIDHSGKQISKDSFEEARMPASNDGPIAVKKNGKWGFADSNGTIVIEPKYDDAKSFSLGLAPVKIGDEWGFIDLEDTVVIEPEYQDAKVFSIDGSAPVKKHNYWSFLVLCEYDN